jgi:hypothetical protein
MKKSFANYLRWHRANAQEFAECNAALAFTTKGQIKNSDEKRFR